MRANLLNEIDRHFSDAIRSAEKSGEAILGCFAVLHRRVCRSILQNRNCFHDPIVVERVTIDFSNRYLDAKHRFEQQRLSVDNPWYPVFETAEHTDVSGIQSLLAAILTHIRWDLPRCLALTVDDLESFSTDYQRIGKLIEAEIEVVQREVPDLSSMVEKFQKLRRRDAPFLFKVIIRRFREDSLRVAVGFSTQSTDERARKEEELRTKVISLNQSILQPKNRPIKKIFRTLHRLESPPEEMLRQFVRI